MDEDRKRSWDVWLGIASPIITVTGLLIGVWQFNTGEQNRVKLENDLLIHKDTIEFHRKLWQEKLDTYRSLVTLAGKIASIVGGPQVDKAKLDPLAQELTAVYWGQTVFVEDPDVAQALKKFHQAVLDYQAGLAGGIPADENVKVTADRLAEACRASINRNVPPGGTQ